MKAGAWIGRLNASQLQKCTIMWLMFCNDKQYLVKPSKKYMDIYFMRW